MKIIICSLLITSLIITYFICKCYQKHKASKLLSIVNEVNIVTTYYESGEKCEVYECINNIKHGKYKKYYENGNIKYSCFFVNGLPDGESKRWYETGEIQCICYHKNGKYNDMFITYDKQNNVIQSTYYIDGVKMLTTYPRKQS